MSRHHKLRLLAHARWSLAAARSAHPLVLAALAACAWMLSGLVLEAPPGWWWFNIQHEHQIEPLVAAFGVGFLLTMVLDGTGRNDPSLSYLATRPVGRRSILFRPVVAPLAIGAAFFLCFYPARDWLANYQGWRAALAAGRDTSPTFAGFQSSRRLAEIRSESADRFRAAGYRPFVPYFDAALRRPDRGVRPPEWAVKMSEGPAKQRALANHREFLFRLEEYRRWRDEGSPMTARMKQHWTIVTLWFNGHWLVWGSWFLAFAAGVTLRAVLVFGADGGPDGVARRFLTPRNLVPLAVLWLLLGGHVLHYFPTVRQVVHLRPTLAGVEWLYRFGPLALLAITAASAWGWSILYGRWLRRNLI